MSVVSARAGIKINREKADSALYSYYKQCELQIDKPGGVAMCDTLFERAGLLGNVRAQAAALSLKLDRYFNTGDEEKLREGVARVQEFCREYDDPELSYFYYYAWGSRLIAYYIKHNKSNAAVYETRKMLARAQEENYVRGIAAGYQMLGNIYHREGAYRLAYDNYLKEIQTIENSETRDRNMPKRYATLAECALKLNLADSATMALKKAAAQPAATPYQQLMVSRAHTLYHLSRRELDSAVVHLNDVRALLSEHPSLDGFRPVCYELKTEYYKKLGDYDRALAIMATRRTDPGACNDDDRYKLYLEEGDIYWLKGNSRRAAECYREYIRLADSVRRREVRNSTDDFTGLLEVERLRNETQKLQVDLHQRRLRNTYLVIGPLALLLLLGALAFTRFNQLYHRLKLSEVKIKAQNDDLRATGEELRRAMESAEHASRMKTDFIQHMSHEVRTPLNAIVGFSQILASQFRNDRETNEYAGIIEENCGSLLRLIDDVLDIASLDRMQLLPSPDCCELNNRCRDCTDRILSEVRPGVAVLFEAAADNPVVRTNVRRIEQVINHLLRNAAKFTLTGQIILNYTCRSNEGVLRFTISDTGPGIPSESQEEIFERFRKLDSFTQGTGLGLSICRIVAEKMGGSLRIDPGYVGGCRMIFEIPCMLVREC